MKRIIDIDKPTFDDIITANSITGHLGRVDWCIRNSKPYEERPQGEWVVCPICRTVMNLPEFCPECGAKMEAENG